MKAHILQWQAAAVPFRLLRESHKLGPLPKASLETFVDLGLTDREIGDYFKIAHPVIAELRKLWRVAQPNAEMPGADGTFSENESVRQYFSA